MVNQQPNIGKPFELPSGPTVAPTQPTLEYFLRELSLSGYTPSSRKKLIQTFAKFRAKLWVKVWTASMDSMGLQEAEPADRLLYYLRMSILHSDRWLEWYERIPTGKYGYEKHWADYQDLRHRGIVGDFGPLLQHACITGILPPELMPAPEPAAPMPQPQMQGVA